jgi:hypothetical protein
MDTQQLITMLNNGTVDFTKVMAVIDAEYQFTPTRFSNGEQVNESGSNNGSCKIFAFARLHDLSAEATLNAFGEFYTVDVMTNPDGSDHANIRNFMRSGWAGIHFYGEALRLK